MTNYLNNQALVSFDTTGIVERPDPFGDGIAATNEQLTQKLNQLITSLAPLSNNDTEATAFALIEVLQLVATSSGGLLADIEEPANGQIHRDTMQEPAVYVWWDGQQWLPRGDKSLVEIAVGALFNDLLVNEETAESAAALVRGSVSAAYDTLEKIEAVLAPLQDSVAGKLGAAEQAQDSIRLNGKTEAELTALVVAVISDGAPSAYDTLVELATLSQSNEGLIQALNAAIAAKADLGGANTFDGPQTINNVLDLIGQNQGQIATKDDKAGILANLLFDNGWKSRQAGHSHNLSLDDATLDVSATETPASAAGEDVSLAPILQASPSNPILNRAQSDARYVQPAALDPLTLPNANLLKGISFGDWALTGGASWAVVDGAEVLTHPNADGTYFSTITIPIQPGSYAIATRLALAAAAGSLYVDGITRDSGGSQVDDLANAMVAFDDADAADASRSISFTASATVTHLELRVVSEGISTATLQEVLEIKLERGAEPTPSSSTAMARMLEIGNQVWAARGKGFAFLDTDFHSLAAAATAAAAANVPLVVTKVHATSQDLTINCPLVFRNTGAISPSAGTVRLRKPVTAALDRQIFFPSGTGKVIGLRDLWVAWFGALGVNLEYDFADALANGAGADESDDAAPIQLAIDCALGAEPNPVDKLGSVGGLPMVRFGERAYGLEVPIEIPLTRDNSAFLQGAGINPNGGTRLIYKGSAAEPAIRWVGGNTFDQVDEVVAYGADSIFVGSIIGANAGAAGSATREVGMRLGDIGDGVSWPRKLTSLVKSRFTNCAVRGFKINWDFVNVREVELIGCQARLSSAAGPDETNVRIAVTNGGLFCGDISLDGCLFDAEGPNALGMNLFIDATDTTEYSFYPGAGQAGEVVTQVIRGIRWDNQGVGYRSKRNVVVRATSATLSSPARHIGKQLGDVFFGKNLQLDGFGDVAIDVLIDGEYAQADFFDLSGVQIRGYGAPRAIDMRAINGAQIHVIDLSKSNIAFAYGVLAFEAVQELNLDDMRLVDCSRASAVTGVSQANPGVVTAPGHGLETGQRVHLSGMTGMDELEGQTVTVTVIDDDSFSIGIDTSGHTAYVSGGQMVRNEHILLKDCPNYSAKGVIAVQRAPAIYPGARHLLRLEGGASGHVESCRGGADGTVDDATNGEFNRFWMNRAADGSAWNSQPRFEKIWRGNFGGADTVTFAHGITGLDIGNGGRLIEVEAFHQTWLGGEGYRPITDVEVTTDNVILTVAPDDNTNDYVVTIRYTGLI